MSKLGKFYSIGIDMLKATPEGKERAGYLHAPLMEKALDEVEAYFGQKNIFYSEPEVKSEGKVDVRVTLDGEPVLCEARFYPILPGDTFETDYEAYGRIDFTRVVVPECGCVEVNLPESKYLVKIAKGSEYHITYEHIEVRAGETTRLETILERYIDLSKEGYFAGDLHHHSIYSSPVWGGTDDVVESCAEVADSMKASGLKFGALSDHHNIFNHKEWKALRSDDFYSIPSKEISTSNGHVLALGVDEYDVIYKIPDAKDRSEEYLRNEFVRITDEIREKDGLPQLNHPRDLSVSISWNRDFYDMTGIFETIEIWNGSNPMYYGSTDAMAADFWRELLEKGQFIPATTGSDTHNIKANDYHKIYGKLLWLKERTEELLSSEDARLFEEKKSILNNFLYICKQYIPMIEVWAKTSLTSGCVRTYVKLPNGEKPNKANVLNALRNGHSFLTNGPLLTVTVNGAGMGEKTAVKDGKADISISLHSNRKLNKLTAYMSNLKAVDIPIKELPTAGDYDYSLELKDFEVGDSSYIFFVASKDVTNIAITNPVLLTK